MLALRLKLIDGGAASACGARATSMAAAAARTNDRRISPSFRGWRPDPGYRLLRRDGGREGSRDLGQMCGTVSLGVVS
jgi:hypothetical protein